MVSPFSMPILAQAAATRLFCQLYNCPNLTRFSRSAATLALACPLLAQGRLPRFEDYPVAETWNGPAAPVKIESRAERTYRTRLTEASKQPPNFAGHYRFTVWGCGSNCMTGAVVDLVTGRIVPLPDDGSHAYFSICQSAFDPSGVACHLNSRLMIVKCGPNLHRAARHERSGRLLPRVGRRPLSSNPASSYS